MDSTLPATERRHSRIRQTRGARRGTRVCRCG